ncbi:LysR family transcriptional regulator [Acidiphilium sp. AL]|uniref:LysR substrate-binding domain-containing protein n=1 Tax=Acidiphilium iwatense TaxID=768198 RepID=A0ABS9E3H0_9PROT|nr:MULTISPECIES: LysR substrate-binding domain-containing protein [Acidiphilium]MCF3948207.1 LysR substrate-binding domain-containing protein [Acidiphilium iwatense]MCU4161676.1 LysR family transcriptional regulator [Acidiphilium sp. AL]
MSTTLLRAFHLVAEAGSFSAAARGSGVGQPTLSAQVKTLEATYGVALFDRRGRGVSATPLGHALHALTARLFAAEDEARTLLSGSATLLRGHLRIAADSATHVMPILVTLKARHANLTFSLSIGNSSDVLDRVLDHHADVAVTARRVSDPRLHSRLLQHDRLVLFVRSDHALAAAGGIPIRALAGHDLVLRERGSITREVFETRLSEHGVRPHTLLEVQTREAVCEAVLAGFGVGVAFEAELPIHPELARVTVEDTDLAVAEYVICLEERQRLPLVRAFLAAGGPPPPRQADAGSKSTQNPLG